MKLSTTEMTILWRLSRLFPTKIFVPCTTLIFVWDGLDPYAKVWISTRQSSLSRSHHTETDAPNVPPGMIDWIKDSERLRVRVSRSKRGHRIQRSTKERTSMAAALYNIVNAWQLIEYKSFIGLVWLLSTERISNTENQSPHQTATQLIQRHSAWWKFNLPNQNPSRINRPPQPASAKCEKMSSNTDCLLDVHNPP